MLLRTYHDIIPVIPRPMRLRDHRSRDERSDRSAEAVESVQDAEDLVGVGHGADPRVPGRVLDAVAEAGEDKHDDEHGVWRVVGDDDVGEEVADGTEDGDAALAEFHVDGVVEQRGQVVADERGEEDQRDDGVAQPVVLG